MEIFVIITILMLLFSAMFSGMEIAFISTNKLHLEVKETKNNFSDKILSKLIYKSDDFITSLLICNNITLVIYGIYSSKIIINIFFSSYNEMLLPSYVLFLQTLIATLIVFILAEFLPKILFLKKSFKMINIFIIPTYIFYIIITYTGINGMVKFISNIFGKILVGKNFIKKDTTFGKIELTNLLNEQIENTASNNEEPELKNEIDIIKNTIEFSDTKIKKCFIPRNEIKSLDINDSLENLKNLFTETGFSKIIIYENSEENILGYVHIYSIFEYPKNIKSILKEIDFIPETLSLYDGMNKLIKSKKSISGVINEYGEISGIITLEDILEELFGEIEDEFDDNKLKEVKVKDNEFIFSSRLEVDYINKKYNINIPISKDYETLNGLILEYNENIPKKGEIIVIEDIFTFKIEEVSDIKIEILRLIISNENNKN